jgi:iron complex outermembrane receptor protein
MKTIYKKLLLLLVILPFSVLAQSGLSGIVTDKTTKQPLPGVNVVIQGSSTGTQTDFDGKFQLPKLKVGDKVLVSYIGYKNQTITYNSQKEVSIALEEESNQLQEVVVQVGYGSVKKKDATGSVALITAKDFNRGAILSTDQLLAGKAAGVRITNDGGQPDSNPNIRIRGGASLNASNSPLIIIDGVPIGDLNPAGVSNPFTLINPNDIESFSILKDASATAIYGIRASNGVILITTKKGTVGAPQFTFSSSLSIGKMAKKVDVMNGEEFTRFIQQYHPSKTNFLGIDDPSTTDQDNLLTPEIEGRILSDTDWQDVITRTSISSDYNFSARANLYKKIPFRASVGYNKTQGIVKTSDYERFSYSFKMTPKFLNDNLKVDINAKGTYSDKNAIDEGGAIGGAISMDPTKPVYGSSFNNKFVGYYQETFINSNRDGKLGSTNPLAVLEQRTRPERATRFLGNIEFDYKLPFIKDLRAVANFGLDASQSRMSEYYSENSLNTYTFNQGTDPTTNYLFNPGLAFLENQTSNNKTMDAYLVYSKSLTGFVTKFDAQAGYSYQDFVTDGNKQETRTDTPDGIRIPNVDENDPTRRYYLPLNLQAFFGRTNIDLLGKYLFTATLRADATSLYVDENKWAYFPAIGAAWKIKEEKFLKNTDFIQDLKLRLGWGKTGQSNITGAAGYFPSRLLFQPGNQNSQYLPGENTYTAKDYNADLSWEKTTTINVGLDFEIFKNSLLNGSVDVYSRKTTDLISVVPFEAGGTVATEFAKNIGSLDSNGFELNLNTKIIDTDNLALNFGGNISYNYNTIIELEGRDVTPDKGSGIRGTGVVLAYNKVGEQPYSALVFEQIYDSNGQPIVGAYKDLNGDGEITNDDRYYKALRPNWTYGFNTTVNYGKWDLAANFRGQIGGQIYNLKKDSNGSIQSGSATDGNSIYNVLNFNTGAANPSFINYNGNAQFSDYLLEDATFLRLDNVTLGYKFSKFVKNSTLKVNTSVNNVFVLSKYSGQDPENFNGIDRTFYPRPRIFTLGLTLDF